MKTYILKRSVFFSLLTGLFLANASLAHAEPSAKHCRLNEPCPIPGDKHNESTFYDIKYSDGEHFKCVIRGLKGRTEGGIYFGGDFGFFPPKGFDVYENDAKLIDIKGKWLRGDDPSQKGDLRIIRYERSEGVAEIICGKD